MKLVLGPFLGVCTTLAVCFGCGAKAKGLPPPTVTVVAPILTTNGQVFWDGKAHVSTQAQLGCTYSWTLSGDPSASITTGQGTNAIAITGFRDSGEVVKVSVKVQAPGGRASASNSVDLTVLPHTHGQDYGHATE